jgi:hypothetical protein
MSKINPVQNGTKDINSVDKKPPSKEDSKDVSLHQLVWNLYF